MLTYRGRMYFRPLFAMRMQKEAAKHKIMVNGYEAVRPSRALPRRGNLVYVAKNE